MTPWPHELAARGVIDRFVDRMFDDMIVGFLFAGKNREGIKRFEYEHAAGTLGADVSYGGRPIVPLHRALKINKGQFRRRLAILRQELDRSGLPPEVSAAWIAAQARLEPAITDGNDCV